ncbi:MAG TPA: hypothetical protein VF704_05710 [Allosphingosinicella sp.]
MDNAHDNDPSQRQSGATNAGELRKPRIEVLRAGPAGAPQPVAAPSAREQPHIEVLEGATPGPPPASVRGTSSGRREQVETSVRRGRGGLSAGRVLALLAFIVIAGALFYTYIQRESVRDHAAREFAAGQESREIPAVPQAGDEAPREPEVRDQSAPEESAAEAAPVEPSASDSDAPVAADRAEPPGRESAAPAGETSALTTARAFYAALSAGDGDSAAQLVVPAKRQRGALSAGALTRYFSSFRRPLRVRRVTSVDADTARVAYDYVLADGRLCEGEAAVRVVQSGDRALVSGIRTRGPC